MYKFKSEVTTIQGLLVIEAHSTEDSTIKAVYTDRTGSWSKEFFTKEEFKAYNKTLRITSMLSVSESGSTAVKAVESDVDTFEDAPVKTIASTKKVKAPKLSTKKELIYNYMLAKRGQYHMLTVLKNVLTVYASKIKKYNKSKNISINSLADELKISSLEVEMIAVSLNHKLLYTVSGTYVQK